MGTWQSPATKEQKKLLRRKRRELIKLHGEIGELFGDDRLYDKFYEVIERIDYGLKTEWVVPDENSMLLNHLPKETK